ncbi:MAG: bifunctional folylpolyglutamate synthase/dihydrofolate synthase, partial [Staphylococcus equorum]|nr:bifunctional folylpolyglutamate synthase/dihydrofolate synthase [Staphylococcus equorum]
LDFNKMIDGIESVSWTGRIEQVKEKPLMIVDGAHNVESVEALISTMKDYYHVDSLDILFSAVKGKPINTMVDQLKTIASTFYVTDFDFPRALTKDAIFEEIRFDQKELVDDYVKFIETYEGDGLIITGSLYFISEVKAKVNF